MKAAAWQVHAVPVPAAAAVSGLYAQPDLADAYAIRLPADASHDAEQLARFVLQHQAPWVGWLMRLRDAIVGRLGLKTAQQLQGAGHAGHPGGSPRAERIGIFRIYRKSPHEVLLGEDDSHLDFRLSVLLERDPDPNTDDEAQRLTVSTVVHCHNRLGRAYIAVIAPFHRAIVQAALRGAGRRGWPGTITPPTPT